MEEIFQQGTIETVFRTNISVNQLSIYGAVTELCEDCKSCRVRTGKLVLVGQSDPLFVPTSVMNTSIPWTDDPAQEDLLQEVSRTSGQAITTKSCDSVGSHNQLHLQGKYGVEIRIESTNKDNSHSWVRISHCLNKLVTDLSNNMEDDDNEQETSEMQFEEFCV